MKCPYCAENVKDEAMICRYCTHDLSTFRLIKPLSERVSSIEDHLTCLENQLSKLSARLDTSEPTSKTAVSESTAATDTTPPYWSQIWLAIVAAATFAAFTDDLSLQLVDRAREGWASLWQMHVLSIVQYVSFAVAGFWTALAWPGRHRLGYALLAIAAVVTYVAAYCLILLPHTITTSFFMVAFTGLEIIRNSGFVALFSLFIAGALFGDVWKHRGTIGGAQELGSTSALARQFAGPGEEPGKWTVLVIQTLGPATIGLVGTVITLAVKGSSP